MKTVLCSTRYQCVTRVSIFCIAVALIAGMAGCVSAGDNPVAPDTEGSDVTSPGEGNSTYVEVILPDANFEAAIRGAASNETGSIHPSDLQRHSFFSGIT